MNWTCVSSLVEVIIALLYDPNLQLKMAAYKPNLKSITKAFTNVSQNLFSMLFLYRILKRVNVESNK